MNKTVELVRLWGVYEEQHPTATLEEFFRHEVLAESKQKGGFPPEGDSLPKGSFPLKGPFPPEGPLIPDINGRLMILIRRIGKYHILYSNKALEGTGLLQIEEFGILVSIFNQGNPFKSEVIFQNMMELSSGTNMLFRMKRRGLISEGSDKEDKRMKRLKLTSKGEQALQKGKVKVLQVAAMMMHALSDEDKQLSIQILHQVHAQFEGKFQKQRNLDFEEIYRENMD